MLSDDAGQFKVVHRALGWIDAERLVHKPPPLIDPNRKAKQPVRTLNWHFYCPLIAYQGHSTPNHKAERQARFDQIFECQDQLYPPR